MYTSCLIYYFRFTLMNTLHTLISIVLLIIFSWFTFRDIITFSDYLPLHVEHRYFYALVITTFTYNLWNRMHNLSDMDIRKWTWLAWDGENKNKTVLKFKSTSKFSFMNMLILELYFIRVRMYVCRYIDMHICAIEGGQIKRKLFK